MSYAAFLLIFVALPLVSLLFFGRRQGVLNKEILTGILVLCLIALLYTSPWDNYLIKKGIWNYPEGAVLGTLGYVPLEEYGFMVLQTGLAGALFALSMRKVNFGKLGFNPIGILLSSFVGILGVVCLSAERGTYAGLILLWAFPPLAIQWALGGRVLLATFSRWIVTWVILTAYLCFADSFAIYEGIWFLNVKTRSGIEIGNLPIEEALFFATTNLFVLQGLSLWQAWRKGTT